MSGTLPTESLVSLTQLAPERKTRYEPVTVNSRRRVLCVFPRYTHSFGTFDHAFPIMGCKAFMPPQGILLIAAYLPKEWEVRFIDENVRPARDSDFAWADVVFMSGMHVQRDFIMEINRKAHAHGKVTVLGGPSVSGCPEWYREIDLLHCGEMGDATDNIIRRLDKDITRPESQEVYTTAERLPLAAFPIPAYDKVRLGDYLLGTIQFSSGCPYRCEFCDIPELYGRNPRLKTPKQVLAELDAMVKQGGLGAMYFVDDNFIGNRKAALALLKELVPWQKRNGYPLDLACEATLNLAEADDVLELMQEARFNTVFCGIETPEEHALEFMMKKQNLRKPIIEAVQKLNGYGMEVVSGIIVGLDTDTPTTGRRILEFIEESGIPMLTINILHALPKTPLWRRLEAEGRLGDGAGKESNVEFLLPYETVVGMWQECVTGAYSPEAVYARFEHQLRETYPKRKKIPADQRKIDPAMIKRAVGILSRLIWTAGIKSDYRRTFWKMAWPRLKSLDIEEVIHVGMVAHHLISFARECADGNGEKCFYSPSRTNAGELLPTG